jgi:hypothetical protein
MKTTEVKKVIINHKPRTKRVILKCVNEYSPSSITIARNEDDLNIKAADHKYAEIVAISDDITDLNIGDRVIVDRMANLQEIKVLNSYNTFEVIQGLIKDGTIEPKSSNRVEIHTYVVTPEYNVITVITQ